MQTAKPKVPPLVHTGLTENYISNPDYKPENLVNTLIAKLSLKNDAALSRVLQLTPAVISKIRAKKAEVTPAILVRMHDVTAMSINDLRALMGMKPPAIPAVA